MNKKSLRLGAKLTLGIIVWLAAGFAMAQDATATQPAAESTSDQVSAEATPVSWFATATALAKIEPAEHHVLRRPIALIEGNAHWVDRNYPYGSTRWDTLPVHLGVEFVNPRHTLVLAAGAGTVTFAGSDADVLIGPLEDYYGNVVILEHELRSLDDQPVFTLYAHLHSTAVEAGDSVDIGEAIGKVGSTGIAIGAHLHFEVRVGDSLDFRNTRNPELWLKNYVDRGMVAGFIHNDAGEPIFGKRVVVRSDLSNREVSTYGSERVNSDPVWGENFIVGDLAAGEYEIVVLNESGTIGYRQKVEVLAYKTTFVDITIAE